MLSYNDIDEIVDWQLAQYKPARLFERPMFEFIKLDEPLSGPYYGPSSNYVER